MESERILDEILNENVTKKVTVNQSNSKVIYKFATLREAKHYELIEDELRSISSQSDTVIDQSNEICTDVKDDTISDTKYEYKLSSPMFSKFYGYCEISDHLEIMKDIVVLNKEKLRAWIKLENLFTSLKYSFIEYKIGNITYGKEWDLKKSARIKMIDENTTTKTHSFRLTNYRIEYEDHTDVWTIKRYRNEKLEYDFTIPELHYILNLLFSFLIKQLCWNSIF